MHTYSLTHNYILTYTSTHKHTHPVIFSANRTAHSLCLLECKLERGFFFLSIAQCKNLGVPLHAFNPQFALWEVMLTDANTLRLPSSRSCKIHAGDNRSHVDYSKGCESCC